MRKKDIIELIITAVLLLALIIVLPGALKPKKQPGALKAPGANKGAALPVQAQSGAQRFLIMEKEGRKQEARRDPFTAAPIVSEGEETGFKLTGIIWDKDKPMAIINERIVGEGDRVSNCQVAAIKKGRVILNDGEKDIELRISYK